MDNAFNIGSYNDGAGNRWNGFVDEVRAYDYSLSTDDIQTIYQTVSTIASTNLMAHDKFDENSGTTANDSGKYAYHGTTVNGDFSAMAETGVSGNAVKLNGTNQYVDLPDYLLDPEEGTVSFWFKANTLVGKDYIIGSGTSGTSRFYFGHNETALWVVEPDDTNTSIASTALSTGTWYHLLYRWKSDGTSEVFLDGVSVGTNPSTTYTSGMKSNALNVGSFSEGSNNFFDGWVDELRFYNYPLSDAEVATRSSEFSP